MRIARQQPYLDAGMQVVYIFLCELRDNNLIWMLECRCTKVASFIEKSSFQAEDYKNKKSLLSFIVKTKNTQANTERMKKDKKKTYSIPF
jgi:hypothetical protein